MRSSKKVVLSLTVLSLVAAATAVAALRMHKSRTRTVEVTQNRAPEVSYTAQEPADEAQRAIRRARSSHYDMRGESARGDDAKRFALTESSPAVMLGSPRSHLPAEPAMPAAQSDAVVLGQITHAQAFMSNDKTAVYSEFTIRVEEALKNSSPSPVSAGSSIVAERYGGAVRFPSGKVVRVGFQGKPLPQAGRRYLFFLKHNSDGDDFSIITAYELRDGRITPLDGLYESGEVARPYAAYQKYKDADEATFLTQVKDAIAQPPLRTN